jgi:hypothetical protein
MSNARVTQQYVEAATTAENRNARVTQQYIEAAVLVDTVVPINARVTQQYVEVAAIQTVPFGLSPCGIVPDIPRPVAFSWGRVPGAYKYQLQVATDELFSGVVLTEETVDPSYTEPGVLDASTTYYWRVRAKIL